MEELRLSAVECIEMHTAEPILLMLKFLLESLCKLQISLKSTTVF